MEKQFFDWKTWNEIPFAGREFFHCILKCRIGEWKEGAIIPRIVMNYTQAIMTFFNEEVEEIDEFDIGLIIYYDVD